MGWAEGQKKGEGAEGTQSAEAGEAGEALGCGEDLKDFENLKDFEDLKNFMAWQCRVRQEAMRGGGGRPSEGMVARILEPEGWRGLEVIFLMHRQDADEYVSQFRFIVQGCFDPRERRERGLKVLSSTYYQNSPMFRNVVTMVFPNNSEVAGRLCEAGKIRFLCRGGGHGFEVTGRVEELGDGDELREGSLWHNRLFSRLFAEGERVVLAVWIEGVVRKE